MLTPQQRRRFDRILDAVLGELPDHLHEMLEEVPVVIEDEPSRRLLREMGIEEDEDLCGLHSGIALTQKSVECPAEMPSQIMLFRGPIMRQAALNGGPGREALEQEVRITLHHEIGHHFGLDEDDLEELGYG
jgi:predicted Zn-dependent protease with MMP-like domain